MLALASIGVLIYFIHHVSQSIYAPYVIAGVAGDLMDTIERIFPRDELAGRRSGAGGGARCSAGGLRRDGDEASANSSGYLQGVDYEALVETAGRSDLLLAVLPRPGRFVSRGDVLARVGPAERIDAATLERLENAFVLGRSRVAPQDVEYAIDQLVEVAVRALSPAIDDPFTAINCIDWLGTALSRLAEKKIPPPYYRDERGRVRLFLMTPITFRGVTDAAFDQIRQQAGNHVAVLIRLLEALTAIAQHTRDPHELAVLERQARMILTSSQRILEESEDLQDIKERFNRFLKGLEG